MKRNGHVYEAFIDQGFTNNNTISNLGEDMRLFVTEITIKVLGYLIGEGDNDDRRLVRIDENTVEISFPQEKIAPPGVPNIFDDIFKNSSWTKALFLFGVPERLENINTIYKWLWHQVLA